MKKLRDVLIVVVLGGVVVFFVFRFIDWVHESSLSHSVVVGEAQIACLNDAMICSFSSEESARAYLNSPEHLAKVKAREEKAAQDAEFKKRVDALVNQGTAMVKAECQKDGHPIWYCNTITDRSLSISVEELLRDRDRKAQERLQTSPQ